MARGGALVGAGVALSIWCAAASGQAPACRDDDRLSETAADLLMSGESLDSSRLLLRARQHGFDGVALHAREGTQGDALATWLSGLRTASEGALVCGEASNESRRLVLASVRGGFMSFDGKLLHGTLERGYHDPSLVVETSEGELKSLPITAAQLNKGYGLPSELGARRVQLLAESAGGPRPVAELSFVPWTEQSAPELQGSAKLRSVESLLGQLESFRRGQGLGSVRENRLLSESAQRHASRLCELGTLAHRLEGEDPEARLRREHVGARGVGEALARAGSSDRAWQALLDSPSHRMALSRKDFTDAGIGQASDKKGQVCLVVLLASWPRRLP